MSARDFSMCLDTLMRLVSHGHNWCSIVNVGVGGAIAMFRRPSATTAEGKAGSGAQMGIFRGASPSCPSAGNCAKWAQAYLKYCLCSKRDGMALTLGLLSVISWGVAEVPQIITNYKHKSTEGLSLAFLMTWIVGDLFNLTGCFLEPETLPTQFYMALLYTITTVILTGQTVYYSYIYPRVKAKKARATSKPPRHQRADASLREKLLGPKVGEIRNNNHLCTTVPVSSSPITVNTEVVRHRHGLSSLGTDYYYTSARSLSSSPVPMAGTWSADHPANSPPEIDDPKESFVSEFSPAQYAPSPLIKNSLSVVPWMALLLGMSVLHFLLGTTAHQEVPNGIVIPVGRRLLLLADDHADSSLRHGSGSGSGIGSFLGWAMAVIYMGGRLPQILLNYTSEKLGMVKTKAKSTVACGCWRMT
uniref:Uncharacterized protein n=2 Tax=Leersia perrieri TaxID=77586 RepID=A0A0D9UZE4_9ORYZ